MLAAVSAVLQHSPVCRVPVVELQCVPFQVHLKLTPLGVVRIAKALLGLAGDQVVFPENPWELLLPLGWYCLAQLITKSTSELSHCSLSSTKQTLLFQPLLVTRG